MTYIDEEGDGVVLTNARLIVHQRLRVGGLLLMACLVGGTLAPVAANAEDASHVTANPDGVGLSDSEWLSTAEFLSPFEEEQLRIKMAAAGDAVPSQSREGLIPESMEDFSAAIVEVSDQIFALQGEFPEVYGRFAVDAEAERVRIAYVETAPPGQIEEFQSRVNEILRPSGYPVEFSLATVSRAQLDAAQDVLGEDPELWRERFGTDQFLTIPDYEEKGILQVFTAHEPNPEWREFTLGDVTVRVELSGEEDGEGVVRFHTRAADSL